MKKILAYLGWYKFLNWLRPTLEDENGKASSKKITALLICLLYIIGNYYVFSTHDKNADLIFKVLVLDACFILVLFGIVTTQNLITLFKIKNNVPIDKSDEVIKS